MSECHSEEIFSGKPHEIVCSCGSAVHIVLWSSVNVSRTPSLREKLLNATLHRSQCSACGSYCTIEHQFLYIDVERGQLVFVFPRSLRYAHKDDEARLNDAVNRCSTSLAGGAALRPRVVYGLDELREKLISEDGNIDDREVEEIKMHLLADHPILLERPLLRFTLVSANESNLTFRATYDHHPNRFRVSIARSLTQITRATRPECVQPAASETTGALFLAKSGWVNWNRFSRLHDALRTLKKYADQLSASGAVAFDPDFFEMLSRLPSPTHMPPWAKRALQSLRDYANEEGEQAAESRLVEARFGVTLTGDWLKNGDTDDVGYVWEALRTIEPRGILGISQLRSIGLQLGGNGNYYDPGSGDITIAGEALRTEARATHVIRHEIGHAVHARFDSCISPWLEQRFGWRTYSTTDADIDTWVSSCGGWGTISIVEQAQIRDGIREALSGPPENSWTAQKLPVFAPNHPWNAADFAPGLAVRQFRGRPSDDYANWPPTTGTVRVALNYWNCKLQVVDAATIQFVRTYLDNYALASPREFFAELYALYHDPADPQSQILPADIKASFTSGFSGCAPPL